MKKIVTSRWVLALLVIAISTSLVGCGPTESQKAADECLRGNQKACEYHAALIEFEAAEAVFKEAERAKEVAEKEKNSAKKAYEASLKTPKPSPTVEPTATEENPFLEPTLAPMEEGGGN